MAKIFSLFLAAVLFLNLANAALALDEQPQKLFNLTVEEIVLTPQKPALNQPVKIKIKVKNNGNTALTTSQGIADISYKFDEFSKERMTYDAPSYDRMINPGEYLYYYFEGRFTRIGEQNLYFLIDAKNELTEEKLDDKGYRVFLEDDNVINKKIEVVSDTDYDLAVDAVTATYSKIVGEPVELKVNVRNTGKASLINEAGLKTVSVVFPGFMLDSAKHDGFPTMENPFEPNEVFSYYYFGKYDKIGELVFSFKADSDNVLKEANLVNNATSTKLVFMGGREQVDDFKILSQSVAMVSSSSLMVSWTTDKATAGKVLSKRSVADQFGENADNAISVSHQITLSELDPGAAYSVQACSKNNSVEKCGSEKPVIMPEGDNLSFTRKPASKSMNAEAVISWSTNLLTDGSAYYKKTGTDNWATIGPDANGLEHVLALKDLKEGEYEYYVVSTSTLATAIKSETYRFKIGAAPAVAVETVPVAATGTPQIIVKQPSVSSPVILVKNADMFDRLKGTIVLKVEDKGAAFYLNPNDKKLYGLGKPDDAFRIIRERGVGISNANLGKIQVGLSDSSGADTDNDGLSDNFEDAIGTDKSKKDSDGDGHDDKTEIKSGFNPRGAGKLPASADFAKKNIGKIFLQTEGKGEAWYLNPTDNKRYFLGRPADAFSVMRKLGLGIGNKDFEKMR